MKPRYRPGKVIAAGRAVRNEIAKFKHLSSNQLQHFQPQNRARLVNSKAGRKGRRANWNIDYEKGIKFDMKSMPYREPENFTVEGVRRWPKRKG